MKSYISTPIVEKSTGDISYIHVPLEAAFGVGNVLYMTSSTSNLSNAPNTPVAAATPMSTAATSILIEPEETPTTAAAPAPVAQSRTMTNLSRLFQMVGLRR